MKKRHVRILFTGGAAIVAAVFILAVTQLQAQQSAPPGEGISSRSTTSIGRQWINRMEALHPSQPMEYFELAEDMADTADGQPMRDAARHLFALAGALDPSGLGRSAALALADMEENEQQKQRLLALAALLGGDAVSRSATVREAEPSAETVLAIGEALSQYRRGRGPQALSTIERGSAGDLLQQYGSLVPGGYNRFLQDCRIYRGDLRPTLSDGELMRMLRLEEALLAGSDRSWHSDLLARDAAPLIEVDPSRIDDAFKVDPQCSVYRNGRWVPPASEQ